MSWHDEHGTPLDNVERRKQYITTAVERGSEWSLHSIYCGHCGTESVAKWSVAHSGKHMDARVSYAVIRGWRSAAVQCTRAARVTDQSRGTICGLSDRAVGEAYRPGPAHKDGDGGSKKHLPYTHGRRRRAGDQGARRRSNKASSPGRWRRSLTRPAVTATRRSARTCDHHRTGHGWTYFIDRRNVTDHAMCRRRQSNRRKHETQLPCTQCACIRVVLSLADVIGRKSRSSENR